MSHQRPGIGLGIIACRKPRHGEAQDVIARPPQAIHHLRCDDQRVGRIEPTRYTDHQPLGARRGEALQQPLDLDVECLVAIGIQLLGRVGHERVAPDRAPQPCISKVRLVLERHAPECRFRVTRQPRGIVERAVTHPFLRDPLGIDIGQQQFGIAAEAL
jgi:hypothetical protein